MALKVDKLQRQKRTQQMMRFDSPHCWRIEDQRKRDLKELLREAVENTAKQQVKEEAK